MIGACGGVGGTVALGLAALAKKLVPQTGLVTGLPEFASVGLIGFDGIVVGGHEIRPETLLSSVTSLHNESKVIRPEVIERCAPALRAMQKNIKPGLVYGAIRQIEELADGKWVRRVSSPAAAVEAAAEDMASFRKRHRLTHVVVVNVASTEPPVVQKAGHQSYAKLSRELAKKGSDVLQTSSLYALAAMTADCSYINFTPSTGSRIEGIEEFARTRDVLWGGRDGKTGETLIKSVLAPMFALRHLKLHSWVGHNVLGNRDGEILSNPAVKASKIKSKDRLVSQIVGYAPQTRTSIEFIPSLKDWKIAWDLIHFEGFLETMMNMQFVWTGTDSILAAPLVIDLVRLTALEFMRGRRGRMEHLGCFFKDPEGAVEHGYVEQWQRLVAHVTGDSTGGRASSRKRS